MHTKTKPPGLSSVYPYTQYVVVCLKLNQSLRATMFPANSLATQVFCHTPTLLPTRDTKSSWTEYPLLPSCCPLSAPCCPRDGRPSCCGPLGPPRSSLSMPLQGIRPWRLLPMSLPQGIKPRQRFPRSAAEVLEFQGIKPWRCSPHTPAPPA